MKKFWLALVLPVILLGCKHNVSPVDIAKINGYWEIEKVILPDGKSKDYNMNETIDFFIIEGNTGFRKKVTPQFNGKYLENGDKEKVDVIFDGDKTYLQYTTEMAKWKEEIIEVSDKNLVLKNAGNLEYHYKKPIPFSVK
jgi:hypothetical protein